MGTFFDEYKSEFNRINNGPASATALREAGTMMHTSICIIDTTRLALQATRHASAIQVSRRLASGLPGLRSVSSAVSRTQSLNEGAVALARIIATSRALNRMNQNGDTIRDHPEDAARLFGALFVGAGTVAEYLPPPANGYADFLKGAGNFFTNIRSIMDPENAHGGQMQTANDSFNNDLYTTHRGL